MFVTDTNGHFVVSLLVRLETEDWDRIIVFNTTSVRLPRVSHQRIEGVPALTLTQTRFCFLAIAVHRLP